VAPWLASFLVIFVAEWSDPTQLATAALVATTGQPISVALVPWQPSGPLLCWLPPVELASRAGAAPSVVSRVSVALFASDDTMVQQCRAER
jgi:Uncharacterized protein family UPF0016